MLLTNTNLFAINPELSEKYSYVRNSYDEKEEITGILKNGKFIALPVTGINLIVSKSSNDKISLRLTL